MCLRLAVTLVFTAATIVVILMTERVGRRLFEDNVMLLAASELNARRRDELDDALEKLLPLSVWHRLSRDTEQKDQGVVDLCPHATVVVVELIDFAKWTTMLLQPDIVFYLGHLYGAFDACCTVNNVVRMKAVGDRYISCSGLLEEAPQESPRIGYTFAVAALQCCLDMLVCLDEANEKLRESFRALRCVVAMHTGAVGGCIIGRSSLSYELVGPALQVCFQMLSIARTDSVTASESSLQTLGLHRCLGNTPSSSSSSEYATYVCLPKHVFSEPTRRVVFSLISIEQLADKVHVEGTLGASDELTTKDELAVFTLVMYNQVHPSNFSEHVGSRMPILGRLQVQQFDPDTIALVNLDREGAPRQAEKTADAVMQRSLWRYRLVCDVCRDQHRLSTGQSSGRIAESLPKECTYGDASFERIVPSAPVAAADDVGSSDSSSSINVDTTIEEASKQAASFGFFGRDSLENFQRNIEPLSPFEYLKPILSCEGPAGHMTRAVLSFFIGVPLFQFVAIEAAFSDFFISQFRSWRVFCFAVLALVLTSMTVSTIVEFLYLTNELADGTPSTAHRRSLSQIGAMPALYVCAAGVVLAVGEVVRSLLVGNGSAQDPRPTRDLVIQISQLHRSSPSCHVTPSPFVFTLRSSSTEYTYQVTLLALVMTLLFVGTALFPLNTMNADFGALYFFGIFIVTIGVLFRLQVFFGCLFLAGIVIVAFRVAELYLYPTMLVTMLFTTLFAIVITKNREVFERQNFGCLCLDVAMLLASDEEVSLQAQLHNMLIPKRFLASLPTSRASGPVAGANGHAGPFSRYFPEICTLEIKLNSMVMSQESFEVNPTLAVKSVESMIDDVDVGMRRAALAVAEQTNRNRRRGSDLVVPYSSNVAYREAPVTASPIVDADRVSRDAKRSLLSSRTAESQRLHVAPQVQRVYFCGDSVLYAGPFWSPGDRNFERDLETAAMELAYFCTNTAAQVRKGEWKGADGYHHRCSSSLSAMVVCIGSGFGTLIGQRSLSFNLLGVVARQSSELLRAAPIGFRGASEAFYRFLTEIEGPRSDRGARSASGASSMFADPMRWRVRGSGLLTVFPFVKASSS